jgi:hypothetical protein
MSFYRVKILISHLILILIILDYNNTHADNVKSIESTCLSMRLGTFEINSIINNSAHTNSILFSCAISVVIGEANQTKEQAILLNKKKEQIADTIWRKGIDAHYTNEDGENLIIALALSYLSEDWRVDKIKQLINQGVNPNCKTLGGFRALDYARDRDDKRIIAILSQ